MDFKDGSLSSLYLQRNHQSCFCACFCRIFRWVPVLFVFSTAAWSYFAYVVQFCIHTVESGIAKGFYLVGFHILFVLFMWSYIQTVFSHGNEVPDHFKVSQEVLLKLYEARRFVEERNAILEDACRHLQLVTRTATSLVRYCEVCEHVKPDRAHHCRVCYTCALKMDHHCPWINNCVGFANYKFFVLFLGYMLFYCLYIAITFIPYFIEILEGDDSNALVIIPPLFVAVMFSVAIGTLFVYHTYLIAVNRTTMESFHRPIFRSEYRRNGFSSGARNNFREVLGNDAALWFLPVFSSLGDGYTFPVTGGDEDEATTRLEYSTNYDSS